MGYFVLCQCHSEKSNICYEWYFCDFFPRTSSLKHVISYAHYKFLLCVLGFSPQAALLNSFPDIFDELLQMFTVQEVAEYVRGTLGSMPSTVDIGQSMDVVKLQSIARTVESRLFFFPGETNVKVHAKFFFFLRRCQNVGTREPNVRVVLFGFILTPFFFFCFSSLRVSEYSAARGSASHPPASTPAEGAAHLFWDPKQHLFHN